MKLAWDVARRYLAPRRRGRFLSFITWVSLGGVTVGVTALIVVIAVMTGAKEDFQEKILDVNPHVTVLEAGSSLRMKEWRTVLDSIRGIQGVVSATPFALTQVVISTSFEYAQPGQLYGIDVEELGEAATGIEERIKDGALPLEETASGLPPLLVGSELANRMFIFPGDTLTLISMENLRRDPLGNLNPAIRQFEVAGTLATGMYDYDMANLYAHLRDVQDLMGTLESDQISGIGVRGHQALDATNLAATVQEVIGYPYDARSWAEMNNALFSALALEKLAMWVILFLIVVVASFNIVSTLVMVVVDRTREIGILKSMGMTNRRILHIFMLQGTWIGVIGTTVGTVLGCFVAWLLDTYEIIQIPPDVYFVDRLPVALHTFDVVLIYVASVAVAFFATIYPAMQASNLEPVEAIRHE
jgi:lipoprotein-releasing system permease protein